MEVKGGANVRKVVFLWWEWNVGVVEQAERGLDDGE